MQIVKHKIKIILHPITYVLNKDQYSMISSIHNIFDIFSVYAYPQAYYDIISKKITENVFSHEFVLPMVLIKLCK